MPRVLIIDDTDIVRVTLKDILEEAGYEGLEAANGAHGLELLEEGTLIWSLLPTWRPGLSGPVRQPDVDEVRTKCASAVCWLRTIA